MIYTKDGYIIGVSENSADKTEYETILNAIKERPTPPQGYGYKLKTDLTWELVEKVVSSETEVSENDYAEAGKILLGVSE